MPDTSPQAELAARIRARRALLDPYFRYVDGEFPLVDADPEVLRDYRRLIDDAKLNVCRIIVDVLSERARIQGWRPVGGDAASPADTDAWRVWSRNRGDLYSRIAHRTALTGKVCYAAVWEPDSDPRYFTVEDPRDTIVDYADGDLRRRERAAKLWDGDKRLTVWDAERTVVYAHDKRDGWQQTTDTGHGFGVVPVVPLPNQPTLKSEGVSDIHDVMPIQRRINQTIYLRALATEISAVTQKWIANLELPQDEDGEPVNPIQAHLAKLWLLESPDDKDLKTGEFSAADLRQFSQVIDGDLTHAAMITRIPRRYLMPTGQEPSGDALRSSESGLVAKVRERTDTWTESWAEVMTLLRGGTDDVEPVEPIWVDPEVYTLGERTDAALKRQALGVPRGQLYEDLGYEPSQIARFPGLRAEEQMERLIFDEPETADAATA